MNTRGFSAYNLARGALLNSKLTLADSGNQPLKLLDIVVSGMGMDPSTGLWLTPLHSIPAVPRVFPFDLIYLDKEYRVLETAEMGPGIEFPAFRPEVASSLILPADTLHRTQTTIGDRLIVCLSGDLEALLAASTLPPPDIAKSAELQGDPVPFSDRKPARAIAIEFIPEKPSASLHGPSTVFDESILTAVAKVAETRNTFEMKEAAPHSASDPGPSIALTDAAHDVPHRVEAAIVEHRIDPEDLFSNWVVSPPAAPQKGRIPPSQKPAPQKFDLPAQGSRPEPTRQNSRKPPASAKSPAEPQTESRPGSTDSVPSEVKPRIKAATEPLYPPAAASRERPQSSAKTDQPVDAPAVAPQPPLSTTFTAVPYGMWQVSMPTAIAPIGAKSPVPAKIAATPDKPDGSKQPTPAKAASASSTSSAREPNSTPIPEPRTAPQRPVARPHQPHQGADPAPYPEDIVSPPKLGVGGVSGSDAHRPGDFVASLQEKLQRAQQSRPTPTTPAENVPPARIPDAATAKPALSSPSLPVPQRAATEPPTLSPNPPDPAAQVAANSTLPASIPIPKPKEPAIPDKVKAEPSSGGFRSKFKQWLSPNSSPSDRRRATRRYVPGMVAHYFTGGAPKPKNVADISMSGLYLLTDDRWMPGTMIQMTLQKPCADGEKKQSINVLSRIVRRGSDGVAAEFVMPDALSRVSHDIQPSQATDKVALARFL